MSADICNYSGWEATCTNGFLMVRLFTGLCSTNMYSHAIYSAPGWHLPHNTLVQQHLLMYKTLCLLQYACCVWTVASMIAATIYSSVTRTEVMKYYQAHPLLGCNKKKKKTQRKSIAILYPRGPSETHLIH